MDLNSFKQNSIMYNKVIALKLLLQKKHFLILSIYVVFGRVITRQAFSRYSDHWNWIYAKLIQPYYQLKWTKLSKALNASQLGQSSMAPPWISLILGGSPLNLGYPKFIKTIPYILYKISWQLLVFWEFLHFTCFPFRYFPTFKFNVILLHLYQEVNPVVVPPKAWL